MSKTRAITFIAALVVAASLTVVPVGASERQVRLAAANITVGDDFFRPKFKTIARGERISWVWRGESRHNVTGMTRSGRVAFRSKTTSRSGYCYTKTFRRAARYRVICTLHADMRMTLRIR